MVYSKEVQEMCCVAKGPNHGPAPIPEEGKWIQAKEIKDISGMTHGIGWCAPQQGCCKLSLNVKDGIIEECLVETIGCSGMTHSDCLRTYSECVLRRWSRDWCRFGGPWKGSRITVWYPLRNEGKGYSLLAAD